MRQHIKPLNVFIWISLLIGISGLTGCGSLAGNVVPQEAPPMEAIYDSVPERDSPEAALQQTAAASTGWDSSKLDWSDTPPVESSEAPRGFTALPNPALKLTIFPHLAGKDRLPIPAYTTVFHPYAETDYVLLP